MAAVYDTDPNMGVWWATPIECESAIARLEREGLLPPRAALARERLAEFRLAWRESNPSEEVRDTALRLLRVHPLRAGDALQLAAALLAAEGRPSTLEFVCLDARLLAAARVEGLRVATPGDPAGAG